MRGKLSREFVLEQLKDLDKFPICIEIDINYIKNNQKIGTDEEYDFVIDHKTIKHDSVHLKHELDLLFEILNNDKKNQLFPLIISIDTSSICIKQGDVSPVPRFVRRKYSDPRVVMRKYSDLDIKDLPLTGGGGGSCHPWQKDKTNKLYKKLNSIIHNCEFNNSENQNNVSFFDISEYFFEELTKLCEKLNKQLEQEKKINTSDFNESWRREEITTLLMTEINPTKDKTNDAVNLLFYFLSNDKQKVDTFFNDMEESEKEKYKELIDTYSSGCMSVHTPLSKLMNKVLIRYRNPTTYTHTNFSENKKILPLNTVHLGLNNSYPNSRSKSYSDFKKPSLKPKEKKVFLRIYPAFQISEKKALMNPGNSDIDCNQTSDYKKLIKTIMEFNYNVNFKEANMIAFNLHDICQKDRGNLVEAFKAAYTPFLQNWSKFKPLEGESFAGGSSRKKRNLKKKKSKKKGKRHRRKTRRL